MSEERYTLDEAAVLLTRRECATHGHAFDVVTLVGEARPTSVICSRCGQSWPVGDVATGPAGDAPSVAVKWDGIYVCLFVDGRLRETAVASDAGTLHWTPRP